MATLRKFTVRLLASALLGGAPVAWADYFIVVSDDNPTTSLSDKEALHLFLGNQRAFPGGTPARAYELAGDELRAGFYRALGAMSLAQVNSYWARLMFSGRNLPPQQLESTAAMVEKVSQDPRAIGWLPTAPTHKGLRTVLVLKAVP